MFVSKTGADIIMDYSFLGKRIRAERLKRNLTQSKLAEDLEISDSYMSYIELGTKSLSLDTLIKIAKRFGISIDYLLQDIVISDDENTVEQFRCLIQNKSAKEKQMALDVIRTMYLYIENPKDY